jgi:hypothetical protein
MPCRDGGYEDEVRVSRKTVSDHEMLEATLCGVFTAIEKGDIVGRTNAIAGGIDSVLDVIDWKEAGVKRGHVEAWWKRHKKEDAARLAREAAAKRKDDLRKIAIGKLSPDELEVLGIKW